MAALLQLDQQFGEAQAPRGFKVAGVEGCALPAIGPTTMPAIIAWIQPGQAKRGPDAQWPSEIGAFERIMLAASTAPDGFPILFLGLKLQVRTRRKKQITDLGKYDQKGDGLI